MSRYIHVKIGLTDGIFLVRKFITTGLMHDMYEFQQDEHTIGWVHKRWCTPCTADGTPIPAPQAPNGSIPCRGLQAVDSTTTDWRTFLKNHWDAEHNHCKVEYLDEFYAIFLRAAYINKQNHEQDKNKSNHQHGEHEPRRADAVLHPSGRRRPAASLPARDTAEVRTEAVAAPRPKPVELSLFPDL